MRKDRYDWSEVDVYIKSHLEERYSDIAKKFPQFTASQISGRARTLGISPKQNKTHWTKSNIAILKKYYPIFGAKYVARLISTTVYAVNKQAQIQGIKRKYKQIHKHICGYLVTKEDDPYKGKLLHRKIMEDYLGRKLNSNEIVHHIDGNKLNNDISNLQVVTRSEHLKIHRDELQQGKNNKRLEN